MPGSNSASARWRHRDEVPDAADLDQHGAVEVAFEHLAAQRADHRAALRAVRRARHRGHRQVAQRQRGGVGSVGGLRQRREPEAGLHHLLDLLLVGATPPGHGVLDLVRCVLDDLAARECRLGERQPTRLPDAHGGAHVDLEEHLLDRDHVGGELGDQGRELGAQRCQTLWQRVGAWRA